MGVQWRAMDDLSTPRPGVRAGELSGVPFSALLLPYRGGRWCCWGEPPPRPHEGFTGFTPQSQVSLVTDVRQEKHDGKEDRHLFSSVSAKGDIEAVLMAFSKSFSKWEV